jgi:hypothetical protein
LIRSAFVALREAAREPDGRHRGFGAAVAHADLLNRRHELHDEFGHLDLVGIRRAERRAVFERGGNGGLDARVIVAMDGWAPGADEVDQLTVIGGDEGRPARGFHEERRATNGAERADGGVHAARDELERAGEELVGSGGRHGLNQKS